MEEIPYKKLTKAELTELALPFIYLHSEEWSILGHSPSKIINYNGEDPAKHLEELDSILKKLPKTNYQLPFSNGLLGYFSYDFGNQLYGINSKQFPNTPLSYWIIPTTIKLWHHHSKKCWLIKHNSPISYEKQILPQANLNNIQFSKTDYTNKISEIKKLIKDGETYEVNFAQQFTMNKKIDPVQTFLEITKKNPSPYQALIHTSNFSVISNSPELLIEKKDQKLTTKPIKGTVPVNSDPSLLLESQKIACELAMIVDLSRNDLAQISKTGTVKVEKHQVIQKLSNVFHTYSEIIGEAKNNLDLSKIVSAMFPGGSVTGCPQKRTMEIINKLEAGPRGVYCGSAGYINHNLDMALNIMIRTLWQQHDYLSLHSGGAIVADSEPTDEYEETIHKASAFLKILS